VASLVARKAKSCAEKYLFEELPVCWDDARHV